MPTRSHGGCRTFLVALSLILCMRIWISSCVALYELDHAYGDWERSLAVIINTVNMNVRNDITRNETESADMKTDSDDSSWFPDFYCAELNYTVSNDYITIISTIDCATDPAVIPVGRTFELRYNPTNAREFIKQDDYYDDVTNLLIRIVLSVVMTVSLIAFVFKYRYDDTYDAQFGQDLESGQAMESPEVRKERILSKMIFGVVREDLSNTTAIGLRSTDSVPTEDVKSTSSSDITIDTAADGTHCSSDSVSEIDLEQQQQVGVEPTVAENSTGEQNAERIDADDKEETLAQDEDKEDSSKVDCPIVPENEERPIAVAGNMLQTMLSSWMRSDDSEDDCCCICLEKYECGEAICVARNVECNHVFHKDCIMDWMMKNHNQCPLCRVDLLK